MGKCIICYNDNIESICSDCVNLFIFMYEHNTLDDKFFLEDPLFCIFSQKIDEKYLDSVSLNKIKSIEKKCKQRIEYKQMKEYDSDLETHLDIFLDGVEYLDMGIIDKLIIFNNNKELKNKYDLFRENIEEQKRIKYHNDISYQINLELPLNRRALLYCLEESQQQGFKILERRINDVLNNNIL
jgi:hypothetical protein